VQIRHYSRFVVNCIVLLSLAAVGRPGFARDNHETIDAQSFGTGTQLGETIGVTLDIYQFSTPADKQILIQAYEKGQNQGLTNALSKMKAVGHLEITGTLGNDCSYIRMFITPTGRKIVFATTRQIRMAEAWTDSNSMSFNLTVGVLELNDQDKARAPALFIPRRNWSSTNRASCSWICYRIRGGCPTSSTGMERRASTDCGTVVGKE
jgi:hypothetical protein